MNADLPRSGLVLGVAGAGAMGRGIAQIAALETVQVLLYDAAPGAAAAGRSSLARTFERLISKGRLDATDAKVALASINVIETLEGFAGADVVVEAIVENLAAKQALFRELETIVAPECVLASNTSSLSITAIASSCWRPQRVAGLHFFNPVPQMKIVEVIEGLRTAPSTIRTLLALVSRMGHAPVQAKDTPGFIVNHAGRGFTTEALHILGENVASPSTIDDILRRQAGFRLGPFELFDLVGLDVSVPVMESIYRQYDDEPRFRPSHLARARLAAGLLGRKSEEGFYRYEGGRVRSARSPPPPAAGEETFDVWLSQSEPSFAKAAEVLLRGLGQQIKAAPRPGPKSLIVTTPAGEDVAAVCHREQLDPRRAIGLDMLVSNATHRTLMLSPATSRLTRRQAQTLLARDGATVSVIRDSQGLVAQRVLAMIVNIGCDIAQQGIASPADIDRAVKLGLGYPQGPLEWGDALGAARVLTVLKRLQSGSGDPRYRPSSWLRRRAELHLSLTHPDPAIEDEQADEPH